MYIYILVSLEGERGGDDVFGPQFCPRARKGGRGDVRLTNFSPISPEGSLGGVGDHRCWEEERELRSTCLIPNFATGCARRQSL
jgi:hypothetical protein